MGVYPSGTGLFCRLAPPLWFLACARGRVGRAIPKRGASSFPPPPDLDPVAALLYTGVTIEGINRNGGKPGEIEQGWVG